MSNPEYSLSFTTGGLFHRESLMLINLYLDLGNWNSVRDKVIAENLLQVRTVSAIKRLSREIISRLKMFSPRELEFFINGSHQEQAYLLWLAVCRRYRFIGEFAIEVLREHFITLKKNLTQEEFDSFFSRKSEWHPELDKISTTTLRKLRQVLFRILREADLLTVANTINAAIFSPRLLALIADNNRHDIFYFPVFEFELKRLIQ